MPIGVKIGIAVVLIVASQYHLWSRLSSGSVFNPEMPREIILLFNWAFGTLLLLAALQLALDVATLIVMVARRAAVSAPDTLRYGIAAIAVTLAAVGVWNAVRVPPVKDIEIEIAGLAPEFDGYRLIQLTDLHLSRLFPVEWAQAVVDKTNTAGGDLVVITGDFIDGTVAERRADIAPLGRLRAPDGIYAIPGNHEYFFGYAEWMRHLKGLGMQMLPNGHVVLTRGGGELVLAGVTDFSAPEVGAPGPDLDAALAGAPAGVPIVLLDHQPREARSAAARGVAVQLSGHTHGGMIQPLDRLVARANNGYVSGAYAAGGMTLYVSNGTGLWPGFALRLGVPPEITRITFRAGRTDAGSTIPSSD